MLNHDENIIKHVNQACLLKNGKVNFFGIYQDYLIFY